MSTVWNRNFKIYVFGIFFSVFGGSISTIALAFLIFESTGQTTDIAVVLGITALVSLLGPFCGWLIDRVNLRMFLSTVDFVRAGSIIVFLIVIERIGISSSIIYTYAAISSLLGLLYRPSIGALMPKLVGIKNIVAANSVMGMIYSSIAIMGYSAGGVLVTFLGAKNALVVDAMTFILMGVVFLCLNETMFFTEESDTQSCQESLKDRSILSIASFTVSSGIIVIPIVIVITGIAIAPFRVEWPRLLSEFYGGLFFALVAGGSVCSSFVIYRLKDHVLQMKWIVGALLVSVALMSVPVFSVMPIAIIVAGLFLGFLTDFASTVTYSAVQVQMPAHLRGQIFGIFEPMENLPLFFVFIAISQMTSHVTYETSFILSALLILALICVIGVMFHKHEVFSKARTTIDNA